MKNKILKRGMVLFASLLILLMPLSMAGCKSDKKPANTSSVGSGNDQGTTGSDGTTDTMNSEDNTTAGTDANGNIVTNPTNTNGGNNGGSGGVNSGGGSSGGGNTNGGNTGPTQIPTVPDTDKIIDKQWYSGTDISKNPLFNPANVAPAINDTVKKMKAGDKAYLPYGNYKYTETIQIVNTSSNLKNCVIILDGIYAQPKTSTFDAMTVAGDNLTLKINKITNNYMSNTYPTKRAGGITFTQSTNCRFDFGQVIGFEYGLRFMPNKSGRNIENNTVNFRYLGDCKYPIYMEAVSGVNASVNKNKFTGGRVRGYTGMTMKKGSAQSTPHTGNVFTTISWESIETTGIDAQYASGSTHYSPRFESVMGINIIEGSASGNNVYNNSVDLAYDKVLLESKNSVLNMPLFKVDPTSHWQDVIKTMRTDSSGRVSYEFFEETFISAEGGTESLAINCANVSVNARTSAVTLKLHSMADYYNAEIWIYVNDATKGVSVVDASGKTVAGSSQLTKGSYKLTYTTSWKLTKVSNSGLL